MQRSNLHQLLSYIITCILNLISPLFYISDVPIIGLVIIIGHYFYYVYWLNSVRCNQYCNKCTNNVISYIINCFMIIINKYWENAHFHWKNQKPEGRYNISYQCISRVIICSSEYWYITTLHNYMYSILNLISSIFTNRKKMVLH